MFLLYHNVLEIHCYFLFSYASWSKNEYIFIEKWNSWMVFSSWCFLLKRKEKNLSSKCCFLLLPMKYCWIVSFSVSFSVISILFNAIENSDVVYFNDWFEKEMETEKENVRKEEKTKNNVPNFVVVVETDKCCLTLCCLFFIDFRHANLISIDIGYFVLFILFLYKIYVVRLRSTYYINIYSHW